MLFFRHEVCGKWRWYSVSIITFRIISKAFSGPSLSRIAGDTNIHTNKLNLEKYEIHLSTMFESHLWTAIKHRLMASNPTWKFHCISHRLYSVSYIWDIIFLCVEMRVRVSPFDACKCKYDRYACTIKHHAFTVLDSTYGKSYKYACMWRQRKGDAR